MEGTELPFDVLIAIPEHRPAAFLEASGLTQAGWVPTDRETLAVKGIWALGETTDLSVSKAGSVAHYQSSVMARNVAARLRGEAPQGAGGARGAGGRHRPTTLEGLRGLMGALELVQGAMTDEMVAGLARRVSTLAALVPDPFVIDALETLARALKASQADYPDVKVPPVGGIFGALRAANDPETRRVMAFALAVMRHLGREFQ